jgi:hypothetical protein
VLVCALARMTDKGPNNFDMVLDGSSWSMLTGPPPVSQCITTSARQHLKPTKHQPAHSHQRPAHTDRSRCLFGITLRRSTKVACSEGTKDSQNQLPVTQCMCTCQTHC